MLCKHLWKNDSQLFRIIPPSCNLCFVRVFVNEESLSEWVTLLCLGFSLEVLLNSSFFFQFMFSKPFFFLFLEERHYGLVQKTKHPRMLVSMCPKASCYSMLTSEMQPSALNHPFHLLSSCKLCDDFIPIL